MHIWLKTLFACCGITLGVAGCQPYSIQYDPPVIIDVKDSGPKQLLAVDHIPDAVPVNEPRTKAGNLSPYTVLGKTYRVMPDAKGFRQTGYASWYGKKFHGRKTSNGEVYDMYGMTAAHKTLPIPSFVRVINQNNGRSIVVRVNDRGPFHGDRIIDLTYTAARKLDFIAAGTAPVLVEVLEPPEGAIFQGLKPSQQTSSQAESKIKNIKVTAATESSDTSATLLEPKAPAPRNSGGYEIPTGTYLQVGAFSAQSRADAHRDDIQQFTTYPVTVEVVDAERLYRVFIGPLKDNWDLVHMQQALVRKGYQEPKVAYRAPRNVKAPVQAMPIH